MTYKLLQMYKEIHNWTLESGAITRADGFQLDNLKAIFWMMTFGLI